MDQSSYGYGAGGGGVSKEGSVYPGERAAYMSSAPSGKRPGRTLTAPESEMLRSFVDKVWSDASHPATKSMKARDDAVSAFGTYVDMYVLKLLEAAAIEKATRDPYGILTVEDVTNAADALKWPSATRPEWEAPRLLKPNPSLLDDLYSLSDVKGKVGGVYAEDAAVDEIFYRTGGALTALALASAEFARKESRNVVTSSDVVMAMTAESPAVPNVVSPMPAKYRAFLGGVTPRRVL